MNLNYVIKRGKELSDIALDFAELRITVFREFPYLYDGNLMYEKEYIKHYLECSDFFIFSVYDGNQMIGATTALPLTFADEEIQKPWIQNHIDIHSIFYFGESLLLKPYRGLGLGHRFFDEREAFAQSLGTFSMATFCSVIRQENHPLQPQNYHSNELFWQKRGYIKKENWICEMAWKDINETKETNKPLVFWTKNIL